MQTIVLVTLPELSSSTTIKLEGERARQVKEAHQGSHKGPEAQAHLCSIIDKLQPHSVAREMLDIPYLAATESDYDIIVTVS